MIELATALKEAGVEHALIGVQEDAEFSSYVDGGIRADFQHARREISQRMLARAEPFSFDGTPVPVVQVEDLRVNSISTACEAISNSSTEKDLDRALGLVARKDR